ncbi:MAG: hypothetical protein HY204_07075 [Nitrospirae bacterium]|nr:hypothetical protein [Nitrospirota bacterium]
MEQLATRGVHGISSITILPPTKDYSKEEIAAAIRDTQADGVLLVTLTDYYTQQYYVPGSSTTTGTATISGDIINYSGRTQNYGGFYISKPRVHYALKLFDASTWKVAWLATSVTGGNAFAKFDTLIQSLAETAVQKLQEDGAIRKKRSSR